jgi:eukaryotic-like serine/threonine-protein kinase
VADSLRFLSPGYLIGDKYSIVQVIGSGGMGIVYEATHLRLGHRVAVKMLLPDLMESENAVERFEREARAVAHLRSPHVARVFDVDALPDGTPYMVMEFLEGRDLAEELVARGTLSVEVAVDYLRQVCDAMAEAHRLGIVHRDLKPANIFLANEGRHSIVKVLDFGISKVLNDAAPGVTTQSGLGTVVYMSPEQVRSARSVDARTDVWALGIVLYEVLTGFQPFSGDSLTAVAAAITADAPASLCSVRNDVPPALERVVMKALEKDRERRFSDAAAFAAANAPFASRQRSSGPRVARTPEPTAPNAEPTQESPRAADLLAPGAHGSSHAPTNDGLVSGKLSSPWRRDRMHARVATWARSRSLWTLAVLGAAVLSSLALVRKVPRPSVPSRSSELSQVLASPLTPTAHLPASPASNAPLPAPSEIGTETPAAKDQLGDAGTSTPAASVDAPRSSGPSEARNARPRTSPVPFSSAAAGKEMTRPPPSSERPTKPKNTYGLPPDPG